MGRLRYAKGPKVSFAEIREEGASDIHCYFKGDLTRERRYPSNKTVLLTYCTVYTRTKCSYWMHAVNPTDRTARDAFLVVLYSTVASCACGCVQQELPSSEAKRWDALSVSEKRINEIHIDRHLHDEDDCHKIVHMYASICAVQNVVATEDFVLHSLLDHELKHLHVSVPVHAHSSRWQAYAPTTTFCSAKSTHMPITFAYVFRGEIPSTACA